MKKQSKIKKTLKKIRECALVAATSVVLSCGGVETDTSNNKITYTKPITWGEMIIEDSNINYDSLSQDEKNLTDELNLLCNNISITENVSKNMEDINNSLKFLHSNNTKEVIKNGELIELNRFIVSGHYYISLDYSSRYDSMYFFKKFNDMVSIKYKYSHFIETNTLRGYGWNNHSVFDRTHIDHFEYDEHSKEKFDNATHYIYMCKKYFDPNNIEENNFSELIVIPRGEMEKIIKKLGLTNEELYKMSNYDMR